MLPPYNLSLVSYCFLLRHVGHKGYITSDSWRNRYRDRERRVPHSTPVIAITNFRRRRQLRRGRSNTRWCPAWAETWGRALSHCIAAERHLWLLLVLYMVAKRTCFLLFFCDRRTCGRMFSVAASSKVQAAYTLVYHGRRLSPNQLTSATPPRAHLTPSAPGSADHHPPSHTRILAR